VLRQSVTLFAILTMLALVCLTIFAQIMFQKSYLPQNNDSFLTARYNSIVLSISGYAFTKILIAIFKPIAESLSEWENYELESVHLDARNLKVYSFIFVNLFSVLISISYSYIASRLSCICKTVPFSVWNPQMWVSKHRLVLFRLPRIHMLFRRFFPGPRPRVC
jgi:hypothetical protein